MSCISCQKQGMLSRAAEDLPAYLWFGHYCADSIFWVMKHHVAYVAPYVGNWGVDGFEKCFRPRITTIWNTRVRPQISWQKAGEKREVKKSRNSMEQLMQLGLPDGSWCDDSIIWKLLWHSHYGTMAPLLLKQSKCWKSWTILQKRAKACKPLGPRKANEAKDMPEVLKWHSDT